MMKILAVLMIMAATKQGCASNPSRIFDTTNIVYGEGTIRSRNFLHEYGKRANSLWRFTSHDWQNYALVLNIKKLRLFYWDGNNQICLGSYNLTIDGELEKCTEFVLEYKKQYIFYNSPTCQNVSSVSNSLVKKMTSFPLDVKYESDGRTIEGVHDSGGIWGFDMDYQFIKCPDSPHVSTTPVTTASESTTIVEFVTTKAERTTEAEWTNEAEQTTQEDRTDEYSTSRKVTVTQVMKESRFSASTESFFRTQISQIPKIRLYQNDKQEGLGLDVRLLIIVLGAGGGSLGVAIIFILAFRCKKCHEKRRPRIRRISQAPLFGLDSPSSPIEPGFPYHVTAARSFSQRSNNRISNQYASIHETNWRENLDYVTMAEVQDENEEGNAIYASVTFNPNINDQELTEYASMTGSHCRGQEATAGNHRYEDWPRHASVPSPIYMRPKSLLTDNSVYVIVTDNENNNEYIMPSQLKTDKPRNVSTRL